MATKKKTTKNKPKKAKKTISNPKKVKKAAKKAVVSKKAVKSKKAAAPKKAAKPKAVKKIVKKVTPHKAVKVPAALKMKSKVTRYGDKELNEFRHLILAKLEEAKKQLHEYQDQITRKDEHGTDDTENRFVNMEDGTSTIEREIASQMAARTRQYIDNLEKALLRIQNKTYGICSITGKLIPKERLLANPIATKTIEAKQMEKKMQQSQPVAQYQVQTQEQESEQD